jgi:hypothetical protein
MVGGSGRRGHPGLERLRDSHSWLVYLQEDAFCQAGGNVESSLAGELSAGGATFGDGGSSLGFGVGVISNVGGASPDSLATVPTIPKISLSTDMLWVRIKSQRLSLFVHDEETSRLYVIPRRSVGETQVYIARRLDWRHCVQPLSSAATIIQETNASSIWYYNPSSSHADMSFVVLNDTQTSPQEICNSAAIGRLLSLSASPRAHQVARQHQGTILNAGYCSTQSMGQRDPIYGVPVPHLKILP